MAKKNNIRSIRFSDEMIEMIESQAGDSFTAKFEALVTRCMWELPSKEKELQRIQELIDYKHTQLRKLDEKIIKLENNIRLTSTAADQYLYQLKASAQLLKNMCITE